MRRPANILILLGLAWMAGQAERLGGAQPAVRTDPGGPGLVRERPEPNLDMTSHSDRHGTVRVLALLRIQGGPGGFHLLELAGAAGILVDEMGGAGSLQGAPVYRLWGRARQAESVLRLRVAVDRDVSVQPLWIAWAFVPDGATRPVPLTTVFWSPLLYPSRSSALTRGPAGARAYYLDPGTAAVLESSNEGRDFTTVFTAGREAEFVQGGRGIDITKMIWRGKVEGWMSRQEKSRSKGYEKYGPLLEPSSADPQPAQ